MPSIADLFITVSSDVGGAISGLTAVDTRLNGTTTSMQGATAAAIPLAAAATAVGGAFLSSIAEASSFESQMNGIKAVMSPEEVLTFGGAVEDLAMKLGRDTVFSSSQAAGAIEELIKAGVPLPEILSGAAASALDLASATGVSVEQAAMFASTAMNTFHASAAELPAIMDTISNVSNATATSVGDLQMGFAQIGPVAAGLGISFEDTATALGIFANNGLRGSDAGTSLKTMLLNLEPDTKAQTAAFRELGLFTEDGANKFFDATGSARSMSEIFEILKTSTADLTDQQKISLLQTAFGTDAVRAATIAAAEGAAGWDKVTESMDKMGGVAVAAAQRNSGLEGSMNSLGGSLESVQITVGNLFLPVLTQMVQGLTSVVNAFGALDPTVQTFIIAAVGIAGAIAGVVAGMVLLGPVITAAGASFAILAAATAPVLLPLLAITAAVAALYLAWETNFGGIREVTAEVITAIEPGLTNIQNFITAFASSIGAMFALLASGDFQGGIFGLEEDSGFILFLFTARDAVIDLLAALEPLVAGALQQLPGIIRTVGDAFNFLGGVLQATGGFWDVLFQVISINLQAIVQVITLSVDTIRAIFEGDWGRVFSNMVETVRVIGGAIVQNIALWLQAIADLLGFGDVWEVFVNNAWELGTRIGEALGNVFGFIGEALSGLPGMIAGLGDFFGPLVEAAWNVGTRLGEAFVNFLGFIGQALSGIPDLIGSLGDLWEPFITGAWNLGPRIGDAIMNVLGFIGQAISGIPGMLGGLGDLWEPFVTGAWNVGARVGDAIQNVLGFVGQAFGGIPDMLAGLGDVFGVIVQAAEALLGRVAAAIEPIKQLLADTFGAFWEFLTGQIQLPEGGGGGGGGGGTTGTITGGLAGPIVSIGTLIISSEAEAEAFLQQVATAVLESATRVSPPVGGTNPALP